MSKTIKLKKLILISLCIVILILISAFSGFGCADVNKEQTEIPNIGGEIAGSDDTGDSDPKPTLNAVVYGGNTVSLCERVVSEYVELPFASGVSYLEECAYQSSLISSDFQSFVLTWESDATNGIYTVKIGNEPDLSDAEIIHTQNRFYKPNCLIPGIKYYWSVSDNFGNETLIDSFVPDGVRFITTRNITDGPGVNNVRDIGGWETEDGRCVKYGMLYRGGMLEGDVDYFRIDDYGKNVFYRLGINTEIDLRGSDDGSQTKAALADCTYIKVPFASYVSILPNEIEGMDYYYHRVRDGLKTIFETLAKTETYPAYFHCLVGQDRTGTLAYLINGLLGVSYEDLTRDYELSAFSQVGNMNRSKPFRVYDSNGNAVMLPSAWECMHKALSTYFSAESGKLSDAIAKYLTDFIGVSHDTLETIKELLLE